MQRRTVLAGLGAAVIVPAVPALAAGKASRSFDIFRDGDNIGTHQMDAVLGANGFEIDIEIKIAVKVVGITAYRYELSNREVWKAGSIVAVDSTVNDDGDKDFAKVRRAGDALQIEGSRYTGEAPLESVTTSYFATPFLKRRPWVSTQSGAPLKVSVNADGRKDGLNRDFP